MTAGYQCRTLLGSARLARIQVASVSSPVTNRRASYRRAAYRRLGTNAEPDAREHYTEHLERLPGSINYYAYQHDREPATVEVSRSRLGISADALVFFSGANFFKILPELSDTWARILAAVPGSVLLLMPFKPELEPHLPAPCRSSRAFGSSCARAGVPPERLCIIDRYRRVRTSIASWASPTSISMRSVRRRLPMLDSILAQVPAVVRRGRVGRSTTALPLMQMVGLDELSCDRRRSTSPRRSPWPPMAATGSAFANGLHQLAQAAVPVYYDTPCSRPG